MSACEVCWAEASRKALMLGGSTVEHYQRELELHPEHATPTPDREEADRG